MGFTAPGEAKRMNERAHVYCTKPACREAQSALTTRQAEFISIMREMHAAGVPLSQAKAADRMGISRSRVQQIKDAILLRGEDNELDALIGVHAAPHAATQETAEDLSRVEVPVGSITMSPPLTASYMSDAEKESLVVPYDDEPDTWSYPRAEYTPSDAGPANPSDDPAQSGADFMV